MEYSPKFYALYRKKQGHATKKIIPLRSPEADFGGLTRPINKITRTLRDFSFS
jgi:hypothetical protein